MILPSIIGLIAAAGCHGLCQTRRAARELMGGEGLVTGYAHDACRAPVRTGRRASGNRRRAAGEIAVGRRTGLPMRANRSTHTAQPGEAANRQTAGRLPLPATLPVRGLRPAIC